MYLEYNISKNNKKLYIIDTLLNKMQRERSLT